MTNEPDYAEALRLIRKHKQPGDTIGKMFMRVAKALEEKPEQLGHLQARGRHYDIIQEAIATYDDYMLDDDYDAQRTLDKIVKRMRERVVLTDAPKNHLPDLPQTVSVPPPKSYIGPFTVEGSSLRDVNGNYVAELSAIWGSIQRDAMVQWLADAANTYAGYPVTRPQCGMPDLSQSVAETLDNQMIPK